MKNIIYPRGIEMMSRLLKNNDIKEKALKNAEKEFLQFNICEGDIENVYWYKYHQWKNIKSIFKIFSNSVKSKNQIYLYFISYYDEKTN